MFYVLGIIINWWKFVFFFIVLFDLGVVYYKTTVKQMFFYLPLIYGMLVLTDFLVLSIMRFLIDTKDYFVEKVITYLERFLLY